jgi:SAM-dependent methyltransferase
MRSKDQTGGLKNCPLCGGASIAAFEVRGFKLYDCEACDHRFVDIRNGPAHVDEVYDEAYFTGGGAGYADYLAEAEVLRSRGKMYAGKLVPYIEEPGRMLDVGSAAGCILKGFEEAGWSCVGLEPNAEMVKIATERFGLDVRQGSLEESETEEIFDLISMIQVAGHFYDPQIAFEKAFELLRPGGFLLVETWDRNSILARLFGRNWHEYSPPSVVHWWTSASLARFLKEKGFEKVTGGIPSKKISGDHARTLLEYKFGKLALLELIPKRFNLPYPSEDLFWALYQKAG